jgi:hypothetical protein
MIASIHQLPVFALGGALTTFAIIALWHQLLLVLGRSEPECRLHCGPVSSGKGCFGDLGLWHCTTCHSSWPHLRDARAHSDVYPGHRFDFWCWEHAVLEAYESEVAS